MAGQTEFLSAARINGIMQGITDPRLMTPPLVWNARIPDVPAFDDEIMAYFVGHVLIADIIADDAKAAIYSQGKFVFETNKVPNLKMGVGMNQTMLNTLQKLNSGWAPPSDQGIFTNWENRTIQAVKYGVELRKEVLKVAMLLDGFSYDKLGIKMSNVTWGMYSDLKVTPSTAWDNTSATPLTDIQALRRIARIRYGINYNRISLSSAAFEYATKTTEFKDQAKTFGFGMFNSVPQPAIPLQSDGMLKAIFTRLLGEGITVEIDDRRYWTQDTAGAITSASIMPIVKVILTDSNDDGNSGAWDFANGIVTESIVSNLGPNGISGKMPVGYGPVAYATLADTALNPPGIVYWGVARGFPRKKVKAVNAALTVGTFADIVSTAEVSPV